MTVDTKAIREVASVTSDSERMQFKPSTVTALLDRLEAAEKEIQLVRNAALEEAAKACSSVYYKHIGEGYAEVRYGIAACEKEIQGLKS